MILQRRDSGPNTRLCSVCTDGLMVLLAATPRLSQRAPRRVSATLMAAWRITASPARCSRGTPGFGGGIVARIVWSSVVVGLTLPFDDFRNANRLYLVHGPCLFNGGPVHSDFLSVVDKEAYREQIHQRQEMLH